MHRIFHLAPSYLPVSDEMQLTTLFLVKRYPVCHFCAKISHMDTSPHTSPLMRAVAPRLDRTQQHALPVQSRTSAGHGDTGADPNPKQSTASAPVVPLPSHLEPTEMVEVAPIIQQEATITNITSL